VVSFSLRVAVSPHVNSIVGHLLLNPNEKTMKVFLFLVWFLLFIAACSDNNSATMTSIQNTAVDNQNSNVPNMVNVKRDVHKPKLPVNNETSKTTFSNTRNLRTLDCGNPNVYSFVVIENPNRKNEAEPLMPKDLNIVIGEETVAKIELPIPDSEAKNFSLNSVEKTKQGFEMKVDWGGWQWHYYLQYYFKCKDGNFFLYKMKKESIEGKDPGDLKNWIKKETKIEPNVPIEKFVMTDYLY